MILEGLSKILWYSNIEIDQEEIKFSKAELESNDALRMLKTTV